MGKYQGEYHDQLREKRNARRKKVHMARNDVRRKKRGYPKHPRPAWPSPVRSR